MKKLAMLVPFALALAACATPPLPAAPKVVYVPVAAQCPKVTVPPKPVLPIQSASYPTAPVWDQVRAQTSSFAILMGDDKQLRALLVPYQQDTPK